MMEKAKKYMEDCLKAFGVHPLPPIVEGEGDRVAYLPSEIENVIFIGRHADLYKVPLSDWLIAAGKALLHQRGSDMAVLEFGYEWEGDEQFSRVADDVDYVMALAAIYQCYLQNPVEVYCTYDDAVAGGDEGSMHNIAVALGLSHPRGLQALGFDPHAQAAIFEEADFFRGVVTRDRPDLSLLIALQNAWQKHRNSGIRLELQERRLRFSRIS
jgi:hypothetical protein